MRPLTAARKAEVENQIRRACDARDAMVKAGIDPVQADVILDRKVAAIVEHEQTRMRWLGEVLDVVMTDLRAKAARGGQ